MSRRAFENAILTSSGSIVVGNLQWTPCHPFILALSSHEFFLVRLDRWAFVNHGLLGCMRRLRNAMLHLKLGLHQRVHFGAPLSGRGCPGCGNRHGQRCGEPRIRCGRKMRVPSFSYPTQKGEQQCKRRKGTNHWRWFKSHLRKKHIPLLFQKLSCHLFVSYRSSCNILQSTWLILKCFTGRLYVDAGHYQGQVAGGKFR